MRPSATPWRALHPVGLAAALALTGSGCPTAPDGPEPVTAVVFDPGLAGSFFDAPWPSDARTTATGAPDLSAFPNHGAGTLLDDYTAAAGALLDGFGTYPLIQLRFDGDLDADRWPPTATSFAADSPILLVDIDPASPEYGRRIPLQLEWRAVANTYVPDRTLSALPAVGFPLRASTTYAFVVLDTLGDADGLPLVVPDRLQSLLDGDGDPAWAAALAPLAAALDDVGVARESLAAATVFTTQDCTSELRAIRDWVTDPANHDAPPLLSLEVPDTWAPYAARFVVYEGTYVTPVFQRGDPPYASEGGGFEFVDGEPVVQRVESVAFSLSVPAVNPPAGGYPVVITLPGTGGTLYDHFHPDESTTQGRLLAERGVAMFSFEPPLVGGRGEPWGAQPDLHSYNFFNLESARSVFRQEAIDTSVAIRLLRETIAVEHPELQLDPSRVAFFGHSQGAHIGALLAAVEPEIGAVMINGMGGVLAYTLVEREQPFDIEALIRDAIGEAEAPLTVFHPVIGLAQTLTDAVDPIAYAPLWFEHAADGEATSVLHSGGFQDWATPPVTVNALAVASNNQLIEPVEWAFPEMAWINSEPIEMPFAGNRTAPDGSAVTAGLITRANLGHWVVQDDYYTAWTAAEFLASALFDGLPTIRAPDHDEDGGGQPGDDGGEPRRDGS